MKYFYDYQKAVKYEQSHATEQEANAEGGDETNV